MLIPARGRCHHDYPGSLPEAEKGSVGWSTGHDHRPACCGAHSTNGLRNPSKCHGLVANGHETNRTHAGRLCPRHYSDQEAAVPAGPLVQNYNQSKQAPHSRGEEWQTQPGEPSTYSAFSSSLLLRSCR
jgi:hypothetical protein